MSTGFCFLENSAITVPVLASDQGVMLACAKRDVIVSRLAMMKLACLSTTKG